MEQEWPKKEKPPMFSRRHYEAVAEILSRHREGSNVEAVIFAFDELFERDNPRYKKDKFMKAVGMEEFT
jgi:hypothetical protein